MNDHTKKAFNRLASFVPEGGWNFDKDSEMYEATDDDAPLNSEAATYNLMWKEAARTLLGSFRELENGINHDLQHINDLETVAKKALARLRLLEGMLEGWGERIQPVGQLDPGVAQVRNEIAEVGDIIEADELENALLTLVPKDPV